MQAQNLATIWRFGKSAGEISDRTDEARKQIYDLAAFTQDSEVPSIPEDSKQPPVSDITITESSRNSRFSKEQKSILRVWFNDNKHDPYPSNDQKDSLASQAGLTRSVSESV